MHIRQRIVLLLTVGAILFPIESAHRAALLVLDKNEERTVVSELVRLAQEKRLIRLEIAALERENTRVIEMPEHLERFRSVIRSAAASPRALSALNAFARRILVAGEREDVRSARLEELRSQLAVVRERYGETQGSANPVSLFTSDTTVVGGEPSDDPFVENKRIVAEVYGNVLQLERERERLEAQLRSRAERKLIALGLKAPQPGERSTGEIRGSAIGFVMPAHGPFSAGFMDAGYRRLFGVPHRGMDIAVPVGTPVVASSDGVVFHVQHGGARGYTYVLVAHFGGFSTLYGHLSSVVVQSGQDIGAGEVIGLSGGAVGAPGSGPMTTGPHVHFEMMKDGVHIDPSTVLL